MLSVPEGDGDAVSGGLSAGVVMAGEFFLLRPVWLRRVNAVIAAARRGRSVMSPYDKLKEGSVGCTVSFGFELSVVGIIRDNERKGWVM